MFVITMIVSETCSSLLKMLIILVKKSDSCFADDDDCEDEVD